MDFRLAIYLKYIEKNFFIFNENLTYYRQNINSISSNFKFSSVNWWKRRLQAYEYIKYFFNINKISYKKNFDYYLTVVINSFFKMKRKILIIGKSFIAQNIYNYLNNFFFIQKISYSEFLRFSLKKIKVFNYIINCSIKKEYLSNKYYSKNDNDFHIANKIINTSVKMIFLSTRKVYKLGNNLNEKSKLQPKCNYSKNKLITEKKLNEILKNRVLILRISNLVGMTDIKKSQRKIHTTFISSFFLLHKKKYNF